MATTSCNVTKSTKPPTHDVRVRSECSFWWAIGPPKVNGLRAVAQDWVLDVVDAVGAAHHAVVRERRDRGRELERRVRVVTLSDSDGDRLAAGATAPQ